MELMRMRLENFQGLKEFELVANGCDISVRGDNGTGKTTVANAIAWLLYDKATTGEKGYNPKTVDENGQDVHYLEHSVEGVFHHAKSMITLKKVMREDWKKKRGSAVEEFNGHLIDYYIDGVPVKQKEFRARLDAICDPERAKILTMPEYFAQDMHWKERRKLLLEVCGDVTDQQVIDAHGELEPLQYFLLKPGSSDQYYTVEEYMAIANARKAEINKDLSLIPARIDEATKAMPNVMGIDENEIAGLLEKAKAMKAMYEGELNALKSAGQNSELRRQMAEANAKMSEAKAEHSAKQAANNREVEKARHLVDVELHETESARNKYVRRRAEVDAEIEKLTAKRSSVLVEYKQVQAETFEQPETCPTCGQAIPEEQRRAAWEQFNLNKSHRLFEINERGKKECSKDMIAALHKERDGIDAKISELEQQAERGRARMLEIELQYDTGLFSTTPEYASLNAEIARIQALIDGEGDVSTEERGRILEAIRDAQREIDTLEGQKLNIRYAAAQKQRIEELKTQEKSLAAEYENVQQGAYLAERFTTLKAEMLTDSINEKFKAVRFKLYDTQINGGIADTCEVMVPCAGGLVPFAKANNAGRVNAGLEIIDTLGKHWGVEMPIILDNAESVVKLIETDAQKIKFIVAEGVRPLMVRED